jgi:uncharacterized protein
VEHHDEQAPQMIDPLEQPPSAAMAAAPRPLGPVQEGERIAALDVLRGFALLGIFMVNMQFFTMPFMRAIFDPTLAEAPPSEQAAWWFVKLLFEYKFVSLFSLMFGMGLAVQLMRADRAGRPFVPVYLRRLIVLGLMGIAHGLFLWYGDILLFYAGIGLVLLLCARLRPKWLLALASAAFVFGVLLVGAMTWLQLTMVEAHERSARSGAALQPASDELEPAIPDEAAESDLAPPDELDEPEAADAEADDAPATPLRGFRAIDASSGDPTSEIWVEAEIAAYKDGPMRDAIVFRALTYAYSVGFGLLGFSWHVLAMFLLGAALLKLDYFADHRRHWHLAFALCGLGIGLPLEFMNVWLQHAADHQYGAHLLPATILHEVGSVFTALGYLGVVTLIVSSGLLRVVTAAIACVGRMALTNYLGQTVVATSLMYWWGLGWFNEVPRVQQIGLVFAIYAAQVLFSVAWLSAFTMGPMEWLWRSVTYVRPQPILRRSSP